MLPARMVYEVDFGPQHGELAALIRSRDWSETALGPAASWSPSLRTILQLMLSSRYSMWMGWGPDLTFFYNDAYAQQTLGAKHPWALGRPAREVWAEIWDTLEPRIDHVLKTGEATWDEGLLLFLQRNGYPEETYHTFSYSLAPSDIAGQPGGLFCVVIEDTERIISDRRIMLLQRLASSLGPTKSASEVFAAVEHCLTSDARDIPFSFTYRFDGDGDGYESHAHRVSQTGFDREHVAVPEHLSLTDVSPWPFAQMLRDGAAVTVPLDPKLQWPHGAWATAPTHALLVPLARQGESRPAGVFVAGLNPHRPLENGLRSFVELVVGQLAASLANAGAYEEQSKRADALAEIDRAKTAFFSNISHEFRTPLTLMLGPTEDALGSPDRALRGAELETVHRNELRLLKLVNALLDFARIEAGRTQASYEPTDLSRLTVDLASTFRSAVERAELAFDVDCAPLPEPIYVDQDMWEKIVLNLLSNALKFTFEGQIAVALRWREDHAELTVRDSGVGIAASELPRLFERFHRIEGSRARTHEGSGIGLALVQDLVRLHGGTIEVASQVDRGTSFRIAIPRGSAHLPQDRISAQRTLAPTSIGAAYVEEAMRWLPRDVRGSTVPEPPRTGARILVVDDNADMRDYIARLLRQHWVVETAADGVEALEAVRRELPELVLCDVMMPRLDGFGLIRELRSDSRTANAPIILLSARAGEEATAEGLRAGADDYLVKPFSASALLVRVEAQLSAARLRATLRRNAEAERGRLETMFRASPAAICLLRGRELIVELANPLILEVWGKDSAIIGKPLLEGLPEIRGQGFDELLQGVYESGAAFQGREVLARLDRRRDGSLQDGYFDFVYAPLMGADGNPEGVFVHAYDVTDKVHARRVLEQLRAAEQRSRQDAEAANRLKDEFLATMSHELRTPLNAILGWASLLQRGNYDAKSQARALATIERNAKTQARLIEDILDVSRIISGKLRLDMRRVDTNALARAALDVVRPAADAKRVSLVVSLMPGDGLELIGDADRLQQVMWNLLSNAVKFTPSEGTVTLRVERVGSAAHIMVRDTGPGIAAEHLPFIFERFRQVDNSISRQYGGLGLGLAIVRHLVELHGGVVSAESAGRGLGTTFTVQLPIRAPHSGHVEVSNDTDGYGERPVAAAARAEPGLLAGVSILVVDDDEDARVLLETALARAGAKVRTVDSVRNALAALEQEPVDVLISDIGMPGEDGFSLMKRVRALPASRGGQVPAIALTAYTRGEDVTRALDVGFVRHVAKPADVDELAQTVAMLAHARK